MRAIKKHLMPLAYFVLLFAVLLFIYLPAFSNPPRSDHWSTLYFFHQIQKVPGVERVVRILNYDPWSHGTYRPFFYLILYFLHRILGANYHCYQAVTFAIYFLNIVLLYKLAAGLGCNKVLTTAFLAVFAFLFSHFDLIAWPFHVSMVIGFSFFLLGFQLYLKFLRSGRFILLALVGTLFLSGMFCYETYILWPLGLIILTSIDHLADRGRFSKGILWKSCLSVIGAVYLFYGVYFALSRIYIPHEEAGASWSSLLSLPRLGFSVLAASASVFYNGILVNVYPPLACPVIIQDNIDLGGLLLRSSPEIEENLFLRQHPNHLARFLEAPLTISGKVDLDSLWQASRPALGMILSILGSLVIIGFVLLIFSLFRQKRFVILKIFLFLFYLLMAELTVLFQARLVTNVSLYIFRQFRYQYVPNALVILIVLFLVGRLVKLTGKNKAIIFSILFIVFVFNISVLRYHIAVLKEQLKPLDMMLSDIRAAIKKGRIDKENKLYIGDEVTRNLPPLCWNQDMAQFMEGNYQWVFNDEEIEAFAFTEKDAVWVVSKDDYSFIKRW